MSRGIFKQPCGCVIQRLTRNIERVFKLCDCCAKEFNDRDASAAERAQARAQVNEAVPA